MGKKELFELPIVGWLMKLSRDISVDRENPRNAVQAIRRAMWYLERNCSIMIFPEGTRSLDGELQAFHDGAFRMAIDAGVPVLPVVVEGTFNCLPKKSWKFGKATGIVVEVLDPIDTTGLKRKDAAELRDRTRARILQRLNELRKRAPATGSQQT
jgi:1-acyl-sn-glycerol-3-phosphate acyltransferase